MMRTPWLLATLLFASLMILVMMGPLEVLVPFLIKDRLGGGPKDHAWVLAAFGIGGAVGSLTMASFRMPRRYLTCMNVMFGVGCLPLLVMGFATAVWQLVVSAFVLGALFSAPMVIWGTLLQRRVPAHMLGRVASLDFFVSVSLMPVSMALAGPVSEAIGLRPTFAIAGIAPVVFAVVAIVWARLPAGRDRPPAARHRRRDRAGRGRTRCRVLAASRSPQTIAAERPGASAALSPSALVSARYGDRGGLRLALTWSPVTKLPPRPRVSMTPDCSSSR